MGWLLTPTDSGTGPFIWDGSLNHITDELKHSSNGEMSTFSSLMLGKAHVTSLLIIEGDIFKEISYVKSIIKVFQKS